MIARALASPSISRSRIAIALLAAGLLSAALSTPSHATLPQDAAAPQLAVNYADLDISTEKGALTLYRRITSAAREVCPAPNKYNARVSQLARNCIRTATARAVREVNSPQLAKVEAAKSGRTSEG
jgi:UrcA family protein